MYNKSKKLLKLGNFVYGNKIQILLIDTDKLLFLKKYKKKKIGIASVFAILRFLKRIVTGKWSSAKGVFKGVLTFAKLTKHESE